MSETISQLVSATSASITDIIPATQGSTGPGSGVTRGVVVSQILSGSLPASFTTLTVSGGMRTGVVTIDDPTADPLGIFNMTLDYTGGTGVVQPNLFINSVVNGAVNNFLWGINSILTVSATGGTGQHVSVAGTSNKDVHNVPTFAYLAQIRDRTGDPSSVSGSIVGMEMDVSANAADDVGTGLRVGIDMISKKYDAGGTDSELGFALRLGSGAGSKWIRGVAATGTFKTAFLDSTAASFDVGADVLRLAAGQTINLGNSRTLSVQTGVLEWNVASSVVFSIADGGQVNTVANYRVDGTQVVGNQNTGWAPMTGTPDKATVYNTATVTLAELAGRVMQLQAALTTHGLLGA